MRTKFISVAAGLAVVASTVSPVLANDVSVSVKASAETRGGILQTIKDLRAKFRTEVKTDRQATDMKVKAEREELRDSTKEKRETLKAKVAAELSLKRKERIQKWVTQMQKRLTNLVDRLNKTADKIQARIDKLAAAGRDVTKLRADLAAARTKVTIAKDAVAGISAQATVIISSNEPTVAFRKLHELEKSVMQKIRDAHQALVKVLASTRGLSVTASASPSPSASASPSVTPTPTATPTTTPTPTATP